MKNVLWFLNFWSRKDTKEIARERLECLISRDRDQTIENKAKEIKGTISAALMDVAAYIEYELKFTDRSGELVIHIPLSGKKNSKEEKYEHCVNCE